MAQFTDDELEQIRKEDEKTIFVNSSRGVIQRFKKVCANWMSVVQVRRYIPSLIHV